MVVPSSGMGNGGKGPVEEKDDSQDDDNGDNHPLILNSHYFE